MSNAFKSSTNASSGSLDSASTSAVPAAGCRLGGAGCSFGGSLVAGLCLPEGWFLAASVRTVAEDSALAGESVACSSGRRLESLEPAASEPSEIVGVRRASNIFSNPARTLAIEWFRKLTQ